MGITTVFTNHEGLHMQAGIRPRGKQGDVAVLRLGLVHDEIEIVFLNPEQMKAFCEKYFIPLEVME